MINKKFKLKPGTKKIFSSPDSVIIGASVDNLPNELNSLKEIP